MPTFNALYYPTWDPTAEFFRSILLFFDKLDVIIPSGVQANYNESNSRVCELLPDVFGELRERTYELQMNESGWQGFGATLDILVQEKSWCNESALLIDARGRVRFDNHVLTHDAKMNDRIRSMLTERGLMRPDLRPLATNLGWDSDFQVVDERASRLLLALHADTQARRHGLRTITDDPMPFSINFLNSEISASGNKANAVLASLIIQTQIPRTIEALSPDEYVELRKRFEEIRKPFQRTMKSLGEDRMLDGISDVTTFQEAIVEITSNFQRAVMKFRQSRASSTVKEWMPLGFTTLATLPGLYSTVTESGPGALTVAELFGQCVPIGISLYQQVTTTKHENDETKSHRLLAEIRNNLLTPQLLQRLTPERY